MAVGGNCEQQPRTFLRQPFDSRLSPAFVLTAHARGGTTRAAHAHHQATRDGPSDRDAPRPDPRTVDTHASHPGCPNGDTPATDALVGRAS